MSDLPCDVHGSTAHGRLHGFYPALLHNGTRTQAKLRLCAQCLYEKIGAHKDEWHDSTLRNGVDPEPQCDGCQQHYENASELSRFFLTAYVGKDQRRDYQAYYCGKCASVISEEFRLHA